MKDRSIDGEQVHPKINKARRFSARTVTVRWSLFLAFAFLILLISGTTLTVSFIGTSRLVNNLACSIIDRTQRQTETELHNLFDPIIRQVTIAHQWVKSGLVKRYDTDALNALFLPGMFHLPQCVSMMVSDMTGYEFTIFRNESGGQLETPVGQVQWVTRDFRPEEWGKKSIWTLWDENGSKKLKQWEKDTIWDEDLVKEFAPSGTKMDASGEKGLVYDPRPRIWHKGARDRYREWTTAEIVQNQQEAIYWTDIDIFFTSKAPGLTASVAVKDPKGDLVVIGYDLLLRDLSIFTRALQPTERGKVFVFTETGQIVGLPRDARLQNEGLLAATLLEPVENTGIPELVACMKSWQARQFDDLLPFRFEEGGQAWWAGFRPFSISTERRLWIGVVVPESDFLAAVRQNQFLILAICVAALAVATILAGYLSRSFARPLQTLVEKSRRISSLDLNPVKHVASHVTEIEQLSYSLEKMRSSLENHITDRLEAEQALQKAHDDLERRVEERTAELKRANEKLQKEITERKRAEEVLQASEKKFKDLIETTTDWMWEVDKNGVYTYASPKVRDLLGYEPKEILGRTPFDLMPEEEAEEIGKFFKEKVVKNEPFYQLENINRHKDGHLVVLETSGTPIFDEKNQLKGYRGIDRDITERKEMEAQQLFAGKILGRINQEGERQDIIHDVLRLVKQFTGFEAVGIRLRQGDDFPYFAVKGFSAEFVEAENYLCARDENGKQIYDSQGNPVLECMCGNVLSGRTDPALPFFTEGGSFWTNSTTMLLASTSEQERQGRTRNRCNKVGYESVALIPLRSSDQVVGLLQLNDTRWGQFTPEMIRFFEGIGASIGIALARIRAEEEAKNLAKFPSENPFPVLRIAEDGTILYSNDAGLTLLGKWERQVGESAPRDWSQLIGDVLDSNRSKIIEVKYGKRIISFVFAPVAKAGYVNVYGRDMTEQKKAEQALQKAHNELEMRVRERTAELNSTVGVLQEEVIQRMRAEETLGRSEEKYRELVENANSIIMRRNVKGEITFFNEFAQKFFGYSEEEILGRNVIGTIIPKTDSVGRDLTAMVRDISKHPDQYHTNENENMRRNGERVWITWTNKPIRDKDGRVVEILAIGNDTTERKRQEKALQQSEARLQDAQRIAHIGNWDWDIVNNQLWWSDEVYRIFGLRPQEFDATYDAFLSHVHPDDREFVKQAVDEALYEHKPYSIDHRIVRPDGAEQIVHEHAEVIQNANNNPVRMRGTVQDVTSQKQAEEKILDDRKQLRSLTAELLLSEERERRKIATDLHDSVGQILAFSDRELGILQKSAPEKLMKSVDEIRHHIKQAVKQTRTLTFDLSPPALYDIGFEAAVEELVEQFSKERKIECHFDSCDQHKLIADHIKILLYRSIRELLTNVVKHSKAKLVRITSSRVNNDIQITVEDDGTGFDISKLESKKGNSKGFGLFSIRERLTHLGGQFDIQSSNGNGTRITLLVPLKPKKLKKGESDYEHPNYIS